MHKFKSRYSNIQLFLLIYSTTKIVILLSNVMFMFIIVKSKTLKFKCISNSNLQLLISVGFSKFLWFGRLPCHYFFAIVNAFILHYVTYYLGR